LRRTNLTLRVKILIKFRHLFEISLYSERFGFELPPALLLPQREGALCLGREVGRVLLLCLIARFFLFLFFKFKIRKRAP
jgi:hypothetical protein